MQLFETVKVYPTEYQKNGIAKTTTADVSVDFPKTSLLSFVFLQARMQQKRR